MLINVLIFRPFDDKKLWPVLMNNYISKNLPRLSQNKRRPAECSGIQMAYAEEMAKKHNNGILRTEDIEFVFSNCVLDGEGNVKENPVHQIVDIGTGMKIDPPAVDLTSCLNI